jgi:hypothetical protein
MDEWIKELLCIYTVKHYSGIKNDILSFVPKLKELEDIVKREISREKCHMFSFIMWTLQNVD